MWHIAHDLQSFGWQPPQMKVLHLLLNMTFIASAVFCAMSRCLLRAAPRGDTIGILAVCV